MPDKHQKTPKDLLTLLIPYNPWWAAAPGGAWKDNLPEYQRPVVRELLADLAELPQMISITGPRRVGKTTALKQVIRHLLDHEKTDPARILYFSFDDPEVYGSADLQRTVFEQLVAHCGAKPGGTGRWYFFLDEIQRLPKWELHLKKYYDLKYPIRFVVSGSASSPIFRSSQESLLGRIKDRHLLPFGFREYCQYHLHGQAVFGVALEQFTNLRSLLMEARGADAMNFVNNMHTALIPFEADIGRAVVNYCREGGFPEVWNLADPVRKMEYLMEQQVRKVLYEDLMALTQYRKPENVLRFFVYLLAHPGIEINMSTVARDAGVERRVVDENLPRLEMTDLIIRIRKFSHKPLRVREGNIKCYPIDLALRNAVLKTWEDFTQNPIMMGLYAENLVAHELRKWPEAIEITYYREKAQEVDFVVTHGGARYLPLEVKHRTAAASLSGLRHFLKRFGLDFGAVVTRERECRLEGNILFLPLRYFLLAN